LGEAWLKWIDACLIRVTVIATERSEEAIQTKLFKAFVWVRSQDIRKAIRTGLDVAESGLLRRCAKANEDIRLTSQ
jgi:hypothetical protein